LKNKIMVRVLCLLMGFLLGANVVSAQTYPARTVYFVAAETGGSTDIVARLIGTRLSQLWDKPVVVENRDPTVGGQYVSQRPPDGYTVLVAGTASWILPLFQPMPFNPAKDVAPVTMVSDSPLLLVALSSFPAKSLADVIKMAKAKSGELNYGIAGTGSAGDVAAQLLNSMAGINIVRIPFRGAAQSLNGLLGGEVQLTFATAPSVQAFIKSGRLKVLAVTSAQPSPIAPGAATIASAGFPAYRVGSQIGVFVPANTPESIVRKLNQDIVRVLAMSDIKTQLTSLGNQVAGGSPKELAAAMKAEVDLVTKLIKNKGPAR
jgi:tripartite-type tricarboxylate transporter receptor subunit TctC